MRRLFRAPILSPLGFLRWAIVLSIPLAIAHLAGLRQYVSILSLTVPEGTPGQLAAWYAGMYLISYVAFTLLAPILVIAAGLFALFSRWSVFRSSSPDAL